MGATKRRQGESVDLGLEKNAYRSKGRPGYRHTGNSVLFGWMLPPKRSKHKGRKKRRP